MVNVKKPDINVKKDGQKDGQKAQAPVAQETPVRPISAEPLVDTPKTAGEKVQLAFQFANDARQLAEAAKSATDLLGERVSGVEGSLTALDGIVGEAEGHAITALVAKEDVQNVRDEALRIRDQIFDPKTGAAALNSQTASLNSLLGITTTQAHAAREDLKKERAEATMNISALDSLAHRLSGGVTRAERIITRMTTAAVGLVKDIKAAVREARQTITDVNEAKSALADSRSDAHKEAEAARAAAQEALAAKNGLQKDAKDAKTALGQANARAQSIAADMDMVKRLEARLGDLTASLDETVAGFKDFIRKAEGKIAELIRQAEDRLAGSATTTAQEISAKRDDAVTAIGVIREELIKRVAQIDLAGANLATILAGAKSAITPEHVDLVVETAEAILQDKIVECLKGSDFESEISSLYAGAADNPVGYPKLVRNILSELSSAEPAKIMVDYANVDEPAADKIKSNAALMLASLPAEGS